MISLNKAADLNVKDKKDLARLSLAQKGIEEHNKGKTIKLKKHQKLLDLLG